MFNVRCGPGAAKLPPYITKIHMDFCASLLGGHQGARVFWRENLPRLKYHNPQIPMLVNRHDENSKDSALSIFMRTTPTPPVTVDASSNITVTPSASTDASSSTTVDPSATVDASSSPIKEKLFYSSRHNMCPLPSPAPNERVVQIKMKDVHSTEILKRFIDESGAKEIKSTDMDNKEKTYFEELARQRAMSLEAVKRRKATKAKERAFLRQARKAGGPKEAA
ncbi:hypothetical protein CDD82_4342 [Ophiocordyceps australis]|uniref:Ribosomal protein/NADH dehydrogenase domain-containing protein n=1 Tax=Ophiocordyceps australis TaxID=1399860 RepID=A0A2C5YXT5_9HYPO|nr:hypothetical protein CDD82_4342 [Ophiocordyceps australis]